jgi:glycosyltransferase involved in cell wall biosynthesis
MKIVLSNASGGWGGVHTITETLVRGLTARGHDIVVLARARSILAARMKELALVEPVAGGMDLSPLGVTRVLRALKRHKPAVVLGMMKKDARVTGPAARIAGVPFVMRHPNDQPIGKSAYHRFLYKSVAHHITNAEQTKRTLLASAPWLQAHDVTVIYNGLDLARFANARPAELPVAKDAFVVAYIGALEPRKGVPDLLAAWPTVAAAVPHAQLVIAGYGSQLEQLQGVAAERVIWLGHRDDVPAILQAIDVLVLPSYREGAPNAVQEAMAAGVPVVATRVSGTPEIVEDGVTGILVPTHAPAQIAAALIDLAGNAEKRERMGCAGAQRANERFAEAVMIDHYEQLLTRFAAPDRA